METAIESRGDILGVFPQTDGVDVFRPFLLVVMRDIGRDEFADGKCLGPCVRIGGIQRVQLEIIPNLFRPDGVLDDRHLKRDGILPKGFGRTEPVYKLIEPFLISRIDGNTEFPHRQTEIEETRHEQNPNHGKDAPNDLQNLFHTLTVFIHYYKYSLIVLQ